MKRVIIRKCYLPKTAEETAEQERPEKCQEAGKYTK